jgi:TonB-dependent SusC/RagA subfamily outer membrane receptor
LREVVAVGYGTQKRRDITGAVASMPQDRLSEIPIPNIPQIIQGAIPGVMIQTNSAGAATSESIMIRGRNSIKASNSPLIIVDGIPYDGQLSDINPNDVQSLEILKDASSAAIYGSRGSNGVILITTKTGKEGELKISYNGYYSVQNPVNLPEILNGEEFYQFKMQRAPNMMTIPEKEIYESGTWVDWYDEILRTGFTNNHNISVAGGTHNSKFYFSGGLLDVKGITLNDNYLRAINRINIETHLNNWLLLGTRSQFTYDDRSGASPSWSAASTTNPLVKAYDENGNLTVYPWGRHATTR